MASYYIRVHALVNRWHVFRVVGTEFEGNRLPYTSQDPTIDDILPLSPLDGDIPRRVGYGLILPGTPEILETGLHSRAFTGLGPFASSVQATYLLSLVVRHVFHQKNDKDRVTKLLELDAALNSFAGSMIPPPGEARGRYCGGYGMFSQWVIIPQNPSSLTREVPFFSSTRVRYH